MKIDKEFVLKENKSIDFPINSKESLYFSDNVFKPFCKIINTKKSTLISFTNSVGVFKIGDSTYRIESKINNFKNLLPILQKVMVTDYKFNSNKKLYHLDSKNLINIETGDNFIEVIIEIFINELNKISSFGFSRTYSQLRENRQFLKGRLLINQQIKKNIVQNNFYCQFNEMTYKTKENIILYNVLTRLQHLPISREQKNKITYFKTNIFNEKLNISDGPINSNFDYNVNRQNMHYELAIKLAEIIHHHLGTKSEARGESIFCNFIIRMDILYERYIFLLIREAIKEYWPNYYVIDQLSIKHIESVNPLIKSKQYLNMYPDIVIFNKTTNKPVIVIDTKYKDIESKNKLNNSDYYQVFTYIQALTYNKNTEQPITGVLLTHGVQGNQYSLPTPLGLFDIFTKTIDIRTSESEIKESIKIMLSNILS